MVAQSPPRPTPSHATEKRGRRALGLALAGLALIPAGIVGGTAEWLPFQYSLLYLAAHALLFLLGVLIASRGAGRTPGWLLLSGGAICAVGGLSTLWPSLPPTARTGLNYLHVMAGVGTIAILFGSVLRTRAPGRSGRWLSPLLLLLSLLLLGGYCYREYAWASWQPPKYDASAAYRFLTATTPEQSGAPHFPSALRAASSSKDGCQSSGCHLEIQQQAAAHAHSRAGSSRAYGRTLAEFVSRCGVEAGRWCNGCHAPDAVIGPGKLSGGPRPEGGGRPGVTCSTCHRTEGVHALYGSAALRLRSAPEQEQHAWQVALRRKEHLAQTLRPSLHRSAEFCGTCHRKNWSLPQNGFHWMPGPDEFGQWQAGRYAPAALFAPGERTRSRGCLGCHTAHGEPTPGRQREQPELQLSAFLRRGPAGRVVHPVEAAPLVQPGEPLLLDVVVRNSGIGHDFPTGMPDLQESWLEVTVLDRSGRVRLASGEVAPGAPLPPSAHAFRLVARDRQQQVVRHGNLDEMVSVSEWRRIPAGAADVARYRFRAPAVGLGRVRVRLLRRRRPDFSRWVGAPVQRLPDLLAQWEGVSGGKPWSALSTAERWRHYGMALAGVKAFPEALQALARAQQAHPGDAETLLALGRVYLDDGDLLAAREQFRQARRGDPDRAQAWEGAVLRRMGQPDQAAARLEPLIRRFPRDLRLRFELGSTYLAALRNVDAARQFEAMLDVDPIDVSAHYNLMLCLQRLNRLTDARREETIYRLLRRESTGTADRTPALEDRPFHLHLLETRP